MTRGICLVVCWAAAAGFGLIAGWVTGYVVGLGFFVAVLMTIMAGLGMALALPVVICPSARPQPHQAAARPAAKTAAAPAPSAPAKPKPAPAAPAAPAATSAASSSDRAHWSTGVAAASGATGGAIGQTGLKPSAKLTEEDTLRAGVGAWRYEGEKPAAAPAAAGEGVRPTALSGPRSGGADDLKRIKGVGPKLEGLLHDLGFYHFDQIAGWSAEEVAWVDENLEGFKGRVSRDEWVAQAKLLAEGGETAFSKKVDKGDVY